MKPCLSLLGILCLCGTSLRAESDREAERAAVLALGELTRAPALREAQGFVSTERLKAVYFDAMPFRGRPTRVFAWLGLPETGKDKVPGIVLVHGGGGTAFREWVETWTRHGFAAISIAVEGQTDQRDETARDPSNPQGWVRHEWAGPARSGIYGDSGAPLRDQWMYHAVADTILANSLLRSLPEVDKDLVGIMGISWGGVITSTVIGIDSRLAFAIPTYGCGNLADADNQYGRALGDNQLYREVWDPMLRLGRAAMPVLWLSWPGDQHFPLDALMACAKATAGESAVSLIPGMRHGHGAAWNPPDSYAFAASIVADGRPWCRVVSSSKAGETVCAVFASSRTLERAVLISATGTGVTGQRNWTETPASLDADGEGNWTATASLPPGATAWILNLNSSGLTMSSGFHEVD